VNERENNLNVLSRDSGYSAASASSGAKRNYNTKFRVNVMPMDIIGIDLIW